MTGARAGGVPDEAEAMIAARDRLDAPPASPDDPAQDPRPRPGGPRTPEGKRRSRCNALKHGLQAQVVLPEDLAAAPPDTTRAPRARTTGRRAPARSRDGPPVRPPCLVGAPGRAAQAAGANELAAGTRPFSCSAPVPRSGAVQCQRRLFR